MSKTPNYDAKVKAILDATRPGEWVCPISLERWTLTQDDIERCRVWNVPPCDLAPFTRMRWLATYSVGVDVWWKPHALTGKPMLTYAHPDSMVSVVTDQEFHSGDFGIQHGLDYDPTKSSVEHLEQLVRTVPMPALYSVASENCVGAGYDHGLNSYMIFGTFAPRNSWYLFRCNDAERCMDGVFVD